MNEKERERKEKVKVKENKKQKSRNKTVRVHLDKEYCEMLYLVLAAIRTPLISQFFTKNRMRKRWEWRRRMTTKTSGSAGGGR